MLGITDLTTFVLGTFAVVLLHEKKKKKVQKKAA